MCLGMKMKEDCAWLKCLELVLEEILLLLAKIVASRLLQRQCEL